MKKTIWLFLAIGIFLISFINAGEEGEFIGTYKFGTCITIPQVCPSCSYSTISAIISPSGIIYSTEQAMTKADTFFSYIFCNATELGDFKVNGHFDVNGVEQVWNYYFTIGKKVTSGSSILYIFILFFSTISLVTTLYFALKIKGKNKRDDENKIVSVNNLKYLKLILFFVSYLIMYFIITITYELCFTYLEIEGLNNIFQWTYYIMGWLIFPILILTVVIIVAQKILDDKLEKELNRGTGGRDE